MCVCVCVCVCQFVFNAMCIHVPFLPVPVPIQLPVTERVPTPAPPPVPITMTVCVTLLWCFYGVSMVFLFVRGMEPYWGRDDYHAVDGGPNHSATSYHQVCLFIRMYTRHAACVCMYTYIDGRIVR